MFPPSAGKRQKEERQWKQKRRLNGRASRRRCCWAAVCWTALSPPASWAGERGRPLRRNITTPAMSFCCARAAQASSSPTAQLTTTGRIRCSCSRPTPAMPASWTAGPESGGYPSASYAAGGTGAAARDRWSASSPPWERRGASACPWTQSWRTCWINCGTRRKRTAVWSAAACWPLCSGGCSSAGRAGRKTDRPTTPAAGSSWPTTTSTGWRTAARSRNGWKPCAPSCTSVPASSTGFSRRPMASPSNSVPSTSGWQRSNTTSAIPT